MPAQMLSIETSYSWIRLIVSITLSTLGCVGLWSLVVALPAVQADFGVHRAGASLPYTLTMIGFMIGGIVVGRLADCLGILPPLAGGTILMCLGYILTASAAGSTNVEWVGTIRAGPLLGVKWKLACASRQLGFPSVPDPIQISVCLNINAVSTAVAVEIASPDWR